MADKGIKTDETLPDLSASDVAAAKKEGALDAVREGAEQRFKSTDGVGVTEPIDDRPQATYDVFHLAYLLELDPALLKKVANGTAGVGYPSITDGQKGGLLETERSGKNRTDVVKVLCDALGLKSPYEVTDAGPNFTNDVSRNVVARG